MLSSTTSSLTSLALSALIAIPSFASSAAAHPGSGPVVARRALDHKALALAHSKRGAEDGSGKTHTLAKRDYYGHATFYNAETGNQGACGGFISNGDWKVAISSMMYGDLGQVSYWCGKSLVVTANGKTTTVVVADACPSTDGSGCGANGLDMTPSLFSFFASQDVGVIDITWHEAGAAPPAPKPDPTPEWTPPPPPPPPPATPKWTPEPTPEWKPSPSPEWTPDPTPEWTPSSSSWTPEWTPPKSSSSSSKKKSTTRSSTTHRSTTRSSSSSRYTSTSTTSSDRARETEDANNARNSTDLSGMNRNSTGINEADGFLNSTSTLPLVGTNATTAAGLGSASTNGTTAINGTDVPANGSTTTAAGRVSSGGNLQDFAQVVLNIAGLAYDAAA